MEGHVLPKTTLKIREYTHPPDRKVMRAIEVTLTHAGGGRLLIELRSRLLVRKSRSRRHSGAQRRCHRAAPHIVVGIAVQIRRVRREDSPICTWLTI
jgi:hypothetical protein